MLPAPISIASRRRPFLGQVATQCGSCNGVTAGTTGYNSRTYHMARGGNIVSPQIVIGNWYVSATVGDLNPGSVKTVFASIEYPVGTYTQVTFSGSTSAVIADGANVISDPVPVTIPDGAFFYVKKYETNTVNIVYADTVGIGSQTDPNSGDVTNNSNVNETLTTSLNGIAGVLIPPLAIIAMTTRPSIGFTGTSNVIGIGETISLPLGDIGYRRLVGPYFPYLTVAVSGDTTANLQTNSPKRLALLDNYVTHRWLEPGPGDPAVLATVLGYLDTFNARWPKANNILSNVGPATTSTDSWATTVNQTASGTEASRVALNAAFATLTGYNQMVDIATPTTQPGSSFAVKNDGSTPNLYTTDGGHWNTAMNLFIQASNVFDPSRIR